jgi:hypothetical protein
MELNGQHCTMHGLEVCNKCHAPWNCWFEMSAGLPKCRQELGCAELNEPANTVRSGNQ